MFTQCAQQQQVDFKVLAQQPGTIIVDVRTVEEFDAGHIPQSINIPLHEIEESVEYLEGYKNIIFICRSGNRSGQATTLFKELGFEHVYNGGGWEEFQRLYLE